SRETGPRASTSSKSVDAPRVPRPFWYRPRSSELGREHQTISAGNEARVDARIVRDLAIQFSQDPRRYTVIGRIRHRSTPQHVVEHQHTSDSQESQAQFVVLVVPFFVSVDESEIVGVRFTGFEPLPECFGSGPKYEFDLVTNSGFVEVLQGNVRPRFIYVAGEDLAIVGESQCRGQAARARED